MSSFAIIVLSTFAVVNGVLSFLTLAAVGSVFDAQRKQAEETRFALTYLTDAISSLNESVEHGLDCLVTIDAELDDERNPSETGSLVQCK